MTERDKIVLLMAYFPLTVKGAKEYIKQIREVCLANGTNEDEWYEYIIEYYKRQAKLGFYND